MSLYQLRPLGLRASLVAFEVRLGAGGEARPRDIREAWTLWSPQGRPHAPYPELSIERAMTGREVMEAQAAAWAAHVAATRRLFGAAPLAGAPPPDRPARGLLAFPVPLFSDCGRWTLAHRDGPRWHFTPAQLRDGLARPIPPANDGGL